MNARRIAVYSEGRHDIGAKLEAELVGSALTALPRLVDRLIGEPEDTRYVCRCFHSTKRVLGKGPKLARKVARAVRESAEQAFAAVVVNIDRDGEGDRIGQLREGRNALEYQGFPPCAVGTAVEAFDSWMIADPNAVEAAGGDKTKCHPSPEGLDGLEKDGKHPKCFAAAAFGGADGLSSRYAEIAKSLRIEHLERCCPEGFAPFAEEVRQRIGPVVKGTA